MSQSQPLVSEPTLIWSLPLTYVPYLRAPKLHTFIHQRVTGRWGHILIVLSQTPRSLSSNLKFPLAQPNLVMGSRGLSWGPRWKNLLASSPNRHQPPLCQLSGNEAPIAKPSLAPSAPEDAAHRWQLPRHLEEGSSRPVVGGLCGTLSRRWLYPCQVVPRGGEIGFLADPGSSLL